jgi:hypothetical protein
MAMSALAAVSGTSYRICEPTTLNPSIAMKCIVQIAVPPMAQAARTSHQARRPGVDAWRTLTAQVRPSSEPSTESA